MAIEKMAPIDLAVRIIRVLDLARDRYPIDVIQDLPLLAEVTYANEIKELYASYRRQLSFTEADVRARIEVVEKIIRDSQRLG